MAVGHRNLFVCLVPSILLALAGPLHSAAIAIQSVAASGVAHAGTNGENVIVIRMSNPDGTPFNVPPEQVEKLAVDNGGVQMKGSKWEFRTLLVPPGYAANFQQVVKDDFNRPTNIRQWAEPGQLRIVQIVRLERGVYWLRIRPMAGPKGQQKVLVNWVPGEYLFRISYVDGANQGDTLGMLEVK